MIRYQVAYCVVCENKLKKTGYYPTLKEAWEALKRTAKEEGLDPSLLGEMPSVIVWQRDTNNNSKKETMTVYRDGDKIKVIITKHY